MVVMSEFPFPQHPKYAFNKGVSRVVHSATECNFPTVYGGFQGALTQLRQVEQFPVYHHALHHRLCLHFTLPFSGRCHQSFDSSCKDCSLASMKSPVSLLPCAVLLQHVAAQGAYLFTIDRSVVSSSTAMLESELASAIVARRRALTADRSIGSMDTNSLDDLNTYGGYQTPLFGETTTEEGPGKLFIRLTDVDMSVGDFEQLPDIWVQNPTRDLLTDFKAIPDRQTKDGICEYLVPPSLNAPNTKGVELIFSYPLEGVRSS